jgi:FKBP-type peptidyl-prolyl cis-trans isomerase SlyD
MIEQGSNVKFHYTLSVDGETLDKSRDREPLTYVHGEGQIVPGLERQLEGMKAGDRKTATVAPEEGYGPHRPEAVHEVPKDAFSDASELKPGDRVAGQAQEQSFEATVTAVTDDMVSLDLNHPLAGKTLTFDVEIVEVG